MISVNQNPFYFIAKLVAPPYRIRGFLITLGLALGSLLDLISLASFFPILLLIVNQDQSESHWLISYVYQVTHFKSASTLGIALILVVVFASVIKTIYQIWITHLKARFAYDISTELADRALTNYLQSSYWKFTVTDYSREINKISNFPLTFANNIIIPVGTLFSELLLLLLLILAVAVYNLQILFWLLAIITPSLLLYHFNRRRIKKISDQIKETYPTLLKFTMESVEGWPEIKSFGKENFFKKKFRNQFEKLGTIFSKDHTLHTNTSRVTELVAVFGVAVLIAFVLLNTNTPGDSIIVLGIYIGVGFRAIPSVNRIFASWLRIKSNEYVLSELNTLGQPMDAFTEVPSNVIRFNESIKLINISFTQPDGTIIFNNLSLTIKKNERILIKGPSGSGKTTLLLLMMRLIKEQSGEVRVDDEIMLPEKEGAWLGKIGYVPQSPYMLDATIQENIAFGILKTNIDTDKVNRLISDLGLRDWVDKLKDGINSVIGERGVKVSGGQRQRLAIARVLYHDAEILLLDEITNQLDPITELEIINVLGLLSKKGKTLVVISHHHNPKGNYDTVYELNAGVLVKAENFNRTENR